MSTEGHSHSEHVTSSTSRAPFSRRRQTKSPRHERTTCRSPRTNDSLGPRQKQPHLGSGGDTREPVTRNRVTERRRDGQRQQRTFRRRQAVTGSCAVPVALVIATAATFGVISIRYESTVSAASTMTVTPADNLRDGQLVVVAGPGQSNIVIWECPAGARDPDLECDQRNWTTAVTTTDAGFTAQFAVEATIEPRRGSTTVCAQRRNRCELLAAIFQPGPAGIQTVRIIGSVPVGLASSAPVPFVDATDSQVNVELDQTYAPAAPGRAALRADVYEPAENADLARPVVVWIHGGAFQTGDKADIARWALDWAHRGYVVVAINYRLRPQGALTDSALLQAAADASIDATRALGWLRSHATAFRIDPNTIVVAGESAGGSIALNLAYHPVPGTPVPVTAISLGGSIPSRSAPRATGVPAIIFYGTEDTIVSPKLMRSDCARIRTTGSTCLIYAYEGAGHGLDPMIANIDRIASSYVANRLGLDATARRPSLATAKNEPSALRRSVLVLSAAALLISFVLVAALRRRARRSD